MYCNYLKCLYSFVFSACVETSWCFLTHGYLEDGGLELPYATRHGVHMLFINFIA